MPSAGKVMMTMVMVMAIGMGIVMGIGMEGTGMAMRMRMVSSGDAAMLSILAHALIECKNTARTFLCCLVGICCINPLHKNGVEKCGWARWFQWIFQRTITSVYGLQRFMFSRYFKCVTYYFFWYFKFNIIQIYGLERFIVCKYFKFVMNYIFCFDLNITLLYYSNL